MSLPSHIQIFRKAAKGAKCRKGRLFIEKILHCFAFLCALCGFAVRYLQLPWFPFPFHE